MRLRQCPYRAIGLRLSTHALENGYEIPQQLISMARALLARQVAVCRQRSAFIVPMHQRAECQ